MKSLFVQSTTSFVGALTLAFLSGAFAFDNGQYQNADPTIRKWFKSVRKLSRHSLL